MLIAISAGLSLSACNSTPPQRTVGLPPQGREFVRELHCMETGYTPVTNASTAWVEANCTHSDTNYPLALAHSRPGGIDPYQGVRTPSGDYQH